MRVAVIGTGRMGGAMAARVAGAGHDLTVWNRTPAKAEGLGGTVAGTAREAVADAEVVIVSLADDAAARAAYGGPDGLVAGLRPGVVVADTSTVAPETVRTLAEDVAATGAALVDTPVSGSVPSVESGTILIMAGGDADAVDRARPALESFAQRIILLGPIGAGATMKLAVNAMVFGLNQTLSEALVLAERAGVGRESAYEVIANSAVAAPFVSYKRAAFEQPGSVPVAFALELVAKDLDLAAALADEVGADMPQLATNRQVVGDAIADGRGGEDLSALAEHLRTTSTTAGRGDRATPNLPSRDFGATAEFYARLGFDEVYRDAGWMILGRGDAWLEFFPYPDLDPASSSFGSCLRLDDVDAFYRGCLDAGLPESTVGMPRVHPPRVEPSGMRIGALIDPEGSLIRLVQNP